MASKVSYIATSTDSPTPVWASRRATTDRPTDRGGPDAGAAAGSARTQESAPAPEEAAGHPERTGGATPAPELTGAVRLIQAQYVGRLDRAQSALESAAEDLRRARDDH